MSTRKAKFEILALLLACGVVLFATNPASAKKDFLERFQAYFGLKETGKCIFCHNVKEKEKPGKGNLGLYGKDLQTVIKSNEEYEINVQFAAVVLFDKDSDGDGATNMEEMALGTYPGDPKSTPTKEALDEYRKRVAEQKAAKAKAGGSAPGATADSTKKQPPKKK